MPDFDQNMHNLSVEDAGRVVRAEYYSVYDTTLSFFSGAGDLSDVELAALNCRLGNLLRTIHQVSSLMTPTVFTYLYNTLG